MSTIYFYSLIAIKLNVAYNFYKILIKITYFKQN